MALCNIKLLGNNILYKDNQEIALSSNFSIENSTNEEYSLQAIPNIQNLPCEILLIDGPNVYNLNQPILFNKYLSFYIKIILNGVQESFQINLVNASCDNEVVMTLNFIYEA
jgi:hypothetical protein